MIVYVTGVPGSGKTLWTIGEVRRLLSLEATRPVYYWFPEGIPDVSSDLKWQRITEPASLHSLPARSIIVVDEAWQLWPQRKASTAVPDVVEAFATHRHRGHDFLVLTQRVTSVDHFIRGLVGRHVHLERQFGLERSRIFEWQKMGDPADRFSKGEALTSEFRFPKELYGLYHSAETHVVEKRLPWKKLAPLALAPVLAAILLWWGVSKVLSTGEDEAAQEQAVMQQPPDPARDLQITREAWAAQFQERVKAQPHSAPFYDASLKPATLPKISGCGEVRVKTKDRHYYKCFCNTQQGTIITTMNNRECRHYLKNGWFDPTRSDEEEGSSGRGGRNELAGAEQRGEQPGTGAAALPESLY